MLGSNNEVDVQLAVFASLAKSPAFALLEPAHYEGTAGTPKVFYCIDESLQFME